MERCLNARESRVVGIADGLAASFAPRAAGHDRDASFPRDNYEELRAAAPA